MDREDFNSVPLSYRFAKATQPDGFGVEELIQKLKNTSTAHEQTDLNATAKHQLKQKQTNLQPTQNYIGSIGEFGILIEHVDWDLTNLQVHPELVNRDATVEASSKSSVIDHNSLTASDQQTPRLDNLPNELQQDIYWQVVVDGGCHEGCGDTAMAEILLAVSLRIRRNTMDAIERYGKGVVQCIVPEEKRQLSGEDFEREKDTYHSSEQWEGDHGPEGMVYGYGNLDEGEKRADW